MRARELLAAQYDAGSRSFTARQIRVDPAALGDDFLRALGAIRAALMPPEGYVLVPVEPTGRMIDAGILAYDGKCESSYVAMLAARPEVTGG